MKKAFDTIPNVRYSMIMNTRIYTNAKDQILEAAEKVAMELGIAQFTIQNVAKMAGLTKGGVTYHYNSKEDLLAALLEKLQKEMFGKLEQSYIKEENKPGRTARTILKMFLDQGGEIQSRFFRIASVMIAVYVYYPNLFESMRQRFKIIMELMKKDELPQEITAIVLACMQGLMMARVFGLYEYDDAFIGRMREQLEALITNGEPL